MSGAELGLAVSVFLACAVEAVEALTIVLAMGTTRSWRSTWYGVAAATVALAIVVAIVGPALTALPLGVLRVVVGGLLLVFGLQWLRKAILRASGFKALHDEEATYLEEIEAAKQAGHEVKAGMDWYAFTVSFKGVLLEGLEVAFIVLTFGSSHGSIPLAAAGAAAGLIVVMIAGAVARHPLSRVPENTMKFSVGIMLTGFGIFWAGEGVHVDWPGGTISLLGILAFLLLLSWGYVTLLRGQKSASLGLPGKMEAS